MEGARDFEVPPDCAKCEGSITRPVSGTSAGMDASRAPSWSTAGFVAGVRLTLPLLPGAVVFAVAVGTLAAHKGLTLLDTVLMSALVYAGAAQLVALEVWPSAITPAGVMALALFTATVNLRFVLMSAALRPWFGSLPSWQSYPMLFFTTDTTWIIGMRHRAEGGSDAALFVGSGLVMWLVWIVATVPGYLFGASLPDLGRLGLDLILPIFFGAMLIPLWRGARRALAWAFAGLVALAVAWLVPGWWFIIAGALAGSIAGGFLDERD
jgi:predicted branched-subunit amino acid permease